MSTKEKFLSELKELIFKYKDANVFYKKINRIDNGTYDTLPDNTLDYHFMYITFKIPEEDITIRVTAKEIIDYLKNKKNKI